MKITVFTSNQARHIALIKDLAHVASQIFAVQECTTVFPGRVADFFKKSDVMREYFEKVIEAERNIFGEPGFLPKNVSSLALKSGDLSLLSQKVLEPALQSDLYIVFGSSYIRGWLINFLVDRGAINIHMGASPYYRGSSCNFWASYDENYDYVGATVHLLSRGLDSGDILYHAFPETKAYEPFDLGMASVEAVHKSLVNHIVSNNLFKIKPVTQDRSLEIKYTVNSQFDDIVAKEYLSCLPQPEDICRSLKNRALGKFIEPYIHNS